MKDLTILTSTSSTYCSFYYYTSKSVLKVTTNFSFVKSLVFILLGSSLVFDNVYHLALHTPLAFMTSHFLGFHPPPLVLPSLYCMFFLWLSLKYWCSLFSPHSVSFPYNCNYLLDVDNSQILPFSLAFFFFNLNLSLTSAYWISPLGYSTSTSNVTHPDGNLPTPNLVLNCK